MAELIGSIHFICKKMTYKDDLIPDFSDWTDGQLADYYAGFREGPDGEYWEEPVTEEDLDSFTRYLDEENVDLRLAVLLGYELLLKELQYFYGTKQPIKKLERAAEDTHVAYAEHQAPARLTEYLRRARRTISHNYFTEQEFADLMRNREYVDEDTGKIMKDFDFDGDYAGRDFGDPQVIKDLVLALVARSQKLYWDSQRITD